MQLRNPRRAVRRLAISRLVSMAGTDASAVALSYALYVQTGSALWLSAGLLITFGLGCVLGKLGGQLADRFDRRRLMVGAELTGAASFAVLAAVSVPAALLGISVIATLGGIVFGPASGAAVPNLVDDEDLTWANSLIATTGTIGKTAGRVGAGALIALAGYESVFVLDAVTFLGSALMIAGTRGEFGPRRPQSLRGRPARDSGLGWRAPLADPVIGPVLLSWSTATFMTSFSMTAETVLVFQLGGGATGLGLLTAGWGIGMVVGSWASGKLLNPSNEALGLLAGRIAMGLSLALVALAPVFWPTVVLYVAGGVAGGFLMVAVQSILQRASTDEVRGELLGIAESLRAGTFALGAISAGFVVEALGAQPTYGLVGLGVIASALPLIGVVRAAGPAPQPALQAA